MSGELVRVSVSHRIGSHRRTMPIETICQTCASKLRVADQYAGKKARCPQCGTIYVVPGYVVPKPSEAVPSGLAETIYKPPLETEKWQVRTPDGRVYGPVPKSELDQWVTEGRIPPEAALQNESASFWRPASEVYPQLRGSGPLHAASNPFAELSTALPFPAQTAASFRRPHRGILILVFAILGWVACPVFAPVAWVMGHADLREMRRGLMDESGMSLTQAGMILGMIYTILGLLFMALLCVGALS
jgi:hypothetical protein